MIRRSRARVASRGIQPCSTALFTALAVVIAPSAGRATQRSGEVTIESPTDSLRVTVCSDDVIHIVATPSGSEDSSANPPWIAKPCEPKEFSFEEDEKGVTVKTAQITIHVFRANGNLSIEDNRGEVLLRERRLEPREYEARTGIATGTSRVIDRFRPAEAEAIYGLGQHQNGIFNYRGATVLLAQENTDIAIPLLFSTKGYGILWNTASASVFDNRSPSDFTLSAEAARSVDYYFLYGPEADQIIHRYRELTGQVPMFAKWVYGLFQSKDHYQSQQELLDVARKYRAEHIPVDTMVQDYYWWTKQGSSEFNRNYPDPIALVENLHRLHFHVMISVWPSFEEGADILRQMQAKNMLVPGTTLYDATNPAARELYWNLLPSTILQKGFDALWLDASEPEDGENSDAVLRDKSIFAGDGVLVSNIYPFLHSQSTYRHWRESFPMKRVFQLTRSGFLGQQHSGTAIWSGDVQSNFWALSRQVPAGLNFMLSGMPYWTTDIGGYGYPAYKDTRDPEFQEVFTRWFEYGVFCPLFRVHGRRANSDNEIWSYGPVAKRLVVYDKLRYRLLPYVYSEAWQVSSRDGTMMRPLVMDWRTDENVWNIGDEFLFGRSILVSPVTHRGATSRLVYLPGSALWYDFWTGDRYAGGQRLGSSAPLERIPLFVRAGSIVPLGPEIEYTDEKPADPIELRVYRGADGAFDLYEDEGDTYNYEKGSYAVIPIRWNETSKTLTFGTRVGEFPGMLSHRRFRVVWVREGVGVGEEPSAATDRIVEYDGNVATTTAP
jgi:alpha-D-xyloside xylohydrolase